MLRVARPCLNITNSINIIVNQRIKVEGSLCLTSCHKAQYLHSTPRCLESDPPGTGTTKEKEKKPLELVNDNLVTRIYKKIFSGVPMSKLKASGYILVTHCTQGIDVLGFFKTFNMPDTFYSWFLVAELHVWLLGARLMAEGDSGRVVRNSMVEALWMDCDNRAKAIGDMATSVRTKHIAGIAEEFQAALFIYDEGILGNDMELANALWRRFFLSMREVEHEQTPLPDPEKMLLLVNYVRRVAHYLDNSDAVDIIVKTEITWPSLIEP